MSLLLLKIKQLMLMIIIYFFKLKKVSEVRTLLANTNDFKNFQSEYIKLVVTKRIMLIMIIMKKKRKTN